MEWVSTPAKKVSVVRPDVVAIDIIDNNDELIESRLRAVSSEKATNDEHFMLYATAVVGAAGCSQCLFPIRACLLPQPAAGTTGLQQETRDTLQH